MNALIKLSEEYIQGQIDYETREGTPQSKEAFAEELLQFSHRLSEKAAQLTGQ